MSIAVFLKKNLKNFNPRIGKLLNYLPFSSRPGLATVYIQRKKDINNFNDLSITNKQNFIFTRMSNIVNYAFNNISFYKDHYSANGFHPDMLKTFDDIHKIPIIRKSDLKKYSLTDRSSNIKKKYPVNTGGSSGKPFELFIEPSSIAHEWAHMHCIWGKLDYKVSDFKLTFGGRENVQNIVDYDIVRNQFSVDIYANPQKIAQKLKIILSKYKIKYLHGYPSSIYKFALFCEQKDNELRDLIKKNLKGVFFGSEFPESLYRNNIERIFEVKSISWYGHTERAVLAYEKFDKGIYVPFQTYGFTETHQEENKSWLLGTSYYNYASPIIRYNTEDSIEDVEIQNGIIQCFKIKDGRRGEFLIDKNGISISLTGLIFGRHHDLFNFVDFIQIKEIETGKIEIHFSSQQITVQEAENLFNQDNLNFDIKFVRRKEPHYSKSGKINLLIK